MTLDEIAEILPVSDLIALRQAGHSFRSIARAHHVARTTLHRYAKLVLPSHIYHNKRMKITPDHCLRCTFLPEARNPLLDDGMCLWCHLELAGISLLTYHETGMATLMLQELQRTGYAAAAFTPHPATATDLYYARQLIQSPLWDNRWNITRTNYHLGWKTAVCRFLLNRRFTGHHNRRTNHIIEIAEQLAKTAT